MNTVSDDRDVFNAQLDTCAVPLYTLSAMNKHSSLLQEGRMPARHNAYWWWLCPPASGWVRL